MKHIHSTEVPRVCAAAILQPTPRASGPPLLEFGDRLVCLGHGRRGLRSGLAVQIAPGIANPGNPASLPLTIGRSPEASASAAGGPAAAVIDFIASNETLDRSDEIILASGWKLENYRRNPVFQNAHQYDDVIFTLGRALITEVRTDAGGRPCLFQRIEFAVEANPMARIAYALYRGGFLNAVSVGFIPLRWENGGPGDGYRRKYLEQELLEVSAVGIPANPQALQLGVEAGAIDRADLREVAELCTRALSGMAPAFQLAKDIPPEGADKNAGVPAPPVAPALQTAAPALPRLSSTASQTISAAPGTHTGALGAGSNEAQLLQLARALRECLRK